MSHNQEFHYPYNFVNSKVTLKTRTDVFITRMQLLRLSWFAAVVKLEKWKKTFIHSDRI